MTVKDLSSLTRMPIKVLSGYNGKVLCHAFKPDNEKHVAIGEREVSTFWADIKVTKGPLGSSIAQPVLCCYAGGAEEYAKEHKSTEPGEGFYDQS